jgi:hypothetical protein
MAHKHSGRCPGCTFQGGLTRHHILPCRIFGRGRHNEHIVLLCRDCHNEVEKLIPLTEVLQTWQYFAIVAKFIKEGNRELPSIHPQRTQKG